MQAIIHDRYGSADVLELRQVEKPPIGDDEVLVAVAAASVNPLDWHYMRGAPFLVRLGAGLGKPKNGLRGVDVAGRVEEVGKDVTVFRPGDEVFGWCHGAFAEYVKEKQANFVHKPSRLTHEQAAAVPVAAFTALQGLRDKGSIQAGQKVLIIGASGGVGSFAVQIAKAFGAEVTGTCSTRNVDMVRSAGADHVIDYTKDRFTEGDERYDLIFQLAGTDSPAILKRALKPEGRLILSSGMGRFSGIDRIIMALVMSPFVKQKFVFFVASENHKDLVILHDLLESGDVTPVVDRTYPLSETPAAVRYVEEGHTRGKVVITVTPGRGATS